MPSRIGYPFIIAAALLWGSTGLAPWLAPAGASASALGIARLLVGGAALLLLAGVRQAFGLLRLHSIGALLGACLAMALFQWSFFAAVGKAGAGITAMVSVATAPFFADAAGAAWKSRRFPAAWRVAAVCVAGGILLLHHGGHIPLAGLLLAIASGAAYAGYTLAAARMESAHRSAGLAGTAIALLGAGLVLLPAGATHLGPLLSMRGFALAAYLGIVATALAYWLFIAGLRCVRPATALVLLYVQPLAAFLTGMLLMNERFDWPELSAVALIIAAALLHLHARDAHSPD